MKIKTEYPRDIREIENTWIPMADGTHLAARIWLPVDAEERPVPAILEYIPYRKSDHYAFTDFGRHPYLAGHGYAAVRVDLRGSGDSDGILYDEYLAQEQDDALEVIEWLAAQPWCSGEVGMFGISWGGFNSLQVAARRPPALKAIITLCSTDDRYGDDVHYVGGCLLGMQMLMWASTMFVFNARPPDPRHVGERWREMWFERMEQTPPFIEAWVSHQRRDAFWKHASVCENYADIEIPVYAVGGWADGYTNAIPRLLEGLSGPKKGLIGPWSHNYPEEGSPGPAIGFNQESLRWWDYWLKGIETGIMDEPMLRAWMPESYVPGPTQAYWPGRWVAASEWPPGEIRPVRLALNGDASLDEDARPEEPLRIVGAEYTGYECGVWCPFGDPGDFPPDQRATDGLSLTFTSPPVEEGMEILGFPEVTLDVVSDRPNALLAVRLCDVAPDGSSTLISRGMLNLTHRESHEHPASLEPGKRYTVTVQLNAVAHALAPGHCWRVGVSPTYWPFVWPSPERVQLTLFSGEASVLMLPVRAANAVEASLAPFEEPEQAPALEVEVMRAPSRGWNVHRDEIGRVFELVDRRDSGRRRILADGLEYDFIASETYRITDGDPLSAYNRSEQAIEIARGDWRTRVETNSVMTCTRDAFHVTNVLNAYEANTRVFTKSWTHSIPRDFV